MLMNRNMLIMYHWVAASAFGFYVLNISGTSKSVDITFELS